MATHEFEGRLYETDRGIETVPPGSTMSGGLKLAIVTVGHAATTALELASKRGKRRTPILPDLSNFNTDFSKNELFNLCVRAQLLGYNRDARRESSRSRIGSWSG
jgi:hypothetical protein